MALFFTSVLLSPLIVHKNPVIGIIYLVCTHRVHTEKCEIVLPMNCSDAF